MQSATALFVTSSSRPKRSVFPRSSSTEGMPEHPIATPLDPRRIACVRESMTMTPTSTPERSAIAARIPCADASGSAGRRTTEPGGAFEASIPAFGRRVPFFMQSRNPGMPPTIRSLSRSTTSTRRGSIW